MSVAAWPVSDQHGLGNVIIGCVAWLQCDFQFDFRHAAWDFPERWLQWLHENELRFAPTAPWGPEMRADETLRKTSRFVGRCPCKLFLNLKPSSFTRKASRYAVSAPSQCGKVPDSHSLLSSECRVAPPPKSWADLVGVDIEGGGWLCCSWMHMQDKFVHSLNAKRSVLLKRCVHSLLVCLPCPILSVLCPAAKETSHCHLGKAKSWMGLATTRTCL